ncbi:MAG TPA: PASTA domain-containing protein [Mycobacteriales bacterium]|nr:PASTA domain-containing protein [Mycobacteriales bacterium]
MAKDSGAWQEGRRAWERLAGWHQDSPSATPGHPDDGDGAVSALADIGRVRHLLDQAELVAVRTARGYGKSWAEIATRLGVTRQSAWERWRDLDETPTPLPAASGAAPLDRDAIIETAAGSVVDMHAGERRRGASVVVPNVLGMSWDGAQQVLRDNHLLGVGSDPDGPPTGWPSGVVTDQTPESGAMVPPGSSVRLWLSPGGGSAGVREPRRPRPTPRSGREMRDELSST